MMNLRLVSRTTLSGQARPRKRAAWFDEIHCSLRASSESLIGVQNTVQNGSLLDERARGNVAALGAV